MEEGVDLDGYLMNAVDNIIFSIYVAHLHHNSVTHFDGGVDNDVV